MSPDQERIFAEILALTRRYYEAAPPREFVPGKSIVPLMTPSYDWREVGQAIECLLTTRITLNQSAGNKVQDFERAFSRYAGAEHAIMTNSGSSANLLALFALANPTTPRSIAPGDEVITPAVTWHTTVSPILCVGAVPVLVDVQLDDFTVDPEAIAAEITPRTRAILPVHLLGNPCDMDAIRAIAERHGLYVIEDACEAHGAEWHGRRCGSLGDVGTFSFFFSHHMTTLEGGMLVTSNGELAELARILRSQGVIRNTQRRAELTAHYRAIPEYSDLDPQYLFANLGFNLRPTEINGGFGLEQLERLPGILEQRRDNGRYWTERLARHSAFFHLPRPAGTEPDPRAWFCFPVVLRREAPFGRREITDFLRARGIETRPIMAGNVAAQPAMKLFAHRCSRLSNAEHIHTHGFFWGNHQGIGAAERAYVADVLDEFLSAFPS
jgi:dTDP-4-amino-4,6-dideoxygalactose transaminase